MRIQTRPIAAPMPSGPRAGRPGARPPALAHQHRHADHRERGAAEEHEVGGRPQRHVLPEDPVPDVVEGQRGQAERRAEDHQRAADRHPPATAEADPGGTRLLAVCQPEAQHAGGERAEEAEQHRPVAWVAERAVIAPVIDVVADVPEAAAHHGQQRHDPDEGRQRGPRRQPEHERGRRPGAREKAGAPAPVRLDQPQQRRAAAAVENAQHGQLIERGPTGRRSRGGDHVTGVRDADIPTVL